MSGSSHSVGNSVEVNREVDEALKRIEKDAILIAPICLSHEDIKDCNEEDLLFDD
jgi:hypothetical protein